jgi:allophanate hydrolase subunit 2
LSGLGPAKLAAGDVLPVAVPLPGELPGEARARQRHDDPIPGVLPDEARARHRREGPPTLFLLPGPRRDWLADPAALAGAWVVSPDSNRVGVRLSGRSLGRAREHAGAELPAEPLVRGAVQLPPSGLPVLFGPDHPTTGGYPVVAVLTEESCDRLAQCRPGDPVVLRWRG